MRRRAEPTLRHRKARDRALVLPLAGALLLTPPLGGIFELEATVGGVPFPLIYVFTVWAVLIAGAAALARQLGEAEAAGEEGEG